MEQKSHWETAKQQYDAAFHFLNVTYAVVNDPKLLVGIVHNIHTSMEQAMTALLVYERERQQIPPYGATFLSKLNVFRSKVAPRYAISSDVAKQLEQLQELVEMHKTCPVEFQRGTRYVLAGKEYQMKVVSRQELKTYLELSKNFLESVEKILSKSNRKA